MSYESPRYEQCPKCGINFDLPQEYDTGQKKHPAIRHCSCVPEQASVIVCVDSPGVQTIVDSLMRRLDEQARFIKVLLAMMPKSTSTPESYCPPWSATLDQRPVDTSMLPEDFIQRVIACADENISSRPKDQGAKYEVCLICGNSSEMGRTNAPSSEIERLSICYSCGVIQKNHPDVFSWVWRIIRWHYHAWATKIPAPEKEPLGRNIITE